VLEAGSVWINRIEFKGLDSHTRLTGSILNTKIMHKKMYSQRMIEFLLSWREEMAAEMGAIQAKTKAWRDEMAAMRDKRMEVDRNAAREEAEPEQDVKMMACQEMEGRQNERKPTSPDRKPEAAQKGEVPKVDAEVMPVGELKKKRHRD
jgi:hypothetical protein